MIIRNFSKFLFESIVHSSPDFINILNMMKDESEVAERLLNLLQNDIKTNYNFIKMSGEPGKLVFVPDNQANRKLSQGASEEELFSAASNPTTIGRLVKSLFNSNKMDINDGALEIFSSRFKALMELKTSENLGISIVKGRDIKDYYLGDNYNTIGRKGTLNKSCMRHEDCQVFFDIYTENPDKVSLVVKENTEGKVEARALLWKTEQGLYLDRVYFTEDRYNNLLNDWTKLKFGNIMSYTNLQGKRLEVKLKPHRMYDNFPYIDTLCFYMRDTDEWMSSATLRNYVPDGLTPKELNKILVCHDTEGGYEVYNSIYSEYLDENISRSDAIYSEALSSWLIASDSVESDYMNDWIPKELAVYSQKFSSFLLKTRSKMVYTSKDGDFDFYPSEYAGHFIKDELSDKLYIPKLKDLLYELNGKYYNLELGRFVKKVAPDSYDIIEETYKSPGTIYMNGSYGYFCTELDEKVFGIKTDKNPIIIEKEQYFRLYSNIVKDELVRLVNEQDVSERLKKEKIEEIEEAHNYLMENDSRYARRNNKA